MHEMPKKYLANPPKKFKNNLGVNLKRWRSAAYTSFLDELDQNADVGFKSRNCTPYVHHEIYQLCRLCLTFIGLGNICGLKYC